MASFVQDCHKPDRDVQKLLFWEADGTAEGLAFQNQQDASALRSLIRPSQKEVLNRAASLWHELHHSFKTPQSRPSELDAKVYDLEVCDEGIMCAQQFLNG